jgi:hypothetical protein
VDHSPNNCPRDFGFQMVKSEFPALASLPSRGSSSAGLAEAFYTAGPPSHQHAGYISQVCKRERYGCRRECHDVSMPHKKSKTHSDDSTRASVTKEMAMPRMARSANIAELNLDTSRIPERPSTTMPGIVNKIIPSPQTSQPEKAQIAVDGTDQRYRNLRIENTLTDEHGDDVRLKKGAHVDITVTAKADRN